MIILLKLLCTFVLSGMLWKQANLMYELCSGKVSEELEKQLPTEIKALVGSPLLSTITFLVVSPIMASLVYAILRVWA